MFHRKLLRKRLEHRKVGYRYFKGCKIRFDDQRPNSLNLHKKSKLDERENHNLEIIKTSWKEPVHGHGLEEYFPVHGIQDS